MYSYVKEPCSWGWDAVGVVDEAIAINGQTSAWLPRPVHLYLQAGRSLIFRPPTTRPWALY